MAMRSSGLSLLQSPAKLCLVPTSRRTLNWGSFFQGARAFDVPKLWVRARPVTTAATAQTLAQPEVLSECDEHAPISAADYDWSKPGPSDPKLIPEVVGYIHSIESMDAGTFPLF